LLGGPGVTNGRPCYCRAVSKGYLIPSTLVLVETALLPWSQMRNIKASRLRRC